MQSSKRNDISIHPFDIEGFEPEESYAGRVVDIWVRSKAPGLEDELY
jgi:hypothetical protein